MSNDPLAEYPVVVTLPVSWGDMDALGHVNNTIYFRWFESARIEYFQRIALESAGTDLAMGPILAAVNCNFRKQLAYPDTVRVGARTLKMGRSSMAIDYLVVSEKNGPSADGTSTIVLFNYQSGKSQPIPPELRSVIESLEGKSFPTAS
jgi:acyl-CoA thioester hydrolase